VLFKNHDILWDRPKSRLGFARGLLARGCKNVS
jgi:hypothetical protein